MDDEKLQYWVELEAFQFQIGTPLRNRFDVKMGDYIKSSGQVFIVVGLLYMEDPPKLLAIDAYKYEDTYFLSGKILRVADTPPPKIKEKLAKPAPIHASMFNNQLFSDVQIRVGASTFYLHKLVLSLRCDKFKAMFQSKCKESVTGIVNIQCEDVIAVEALLKFIYTDTVVLKDLPFSSVLKLGQLADEYLLGKLVAKCNSFLASIVSVANVADIVDYVSVYGHRTLLFECHAFVLKNCLEIKNLDDFPARFFAQTVRYQASINQNKVCVPVYNTNSEYCFLFAGMHWMLKLNDDVSVKIKTTNCYATTPVKFMAYAYTDTDLRAVVLLSNTKILKKWIAQTGPHLENGYDLFFEVIN